jgi:hypothetical protein
MVPFTARPLRAQEADSPKLHVDSRRLQGTLEKLSEFGRNPEGGVTRLGFSEADLTAREYVSTLMREAGLEVRVDPAETCSANVSSSSREPFRSVPVGSVVQFRTPFVQRFGVASGSQAMAHPVFARCPPGHQGVNKRYTPASECNHYQTQGFLCSSAQQPSPDVNAR